MKFLQMRYCIIPSVLPPLLSLDGLSPHMCSPFRPLLLCNQIPATQNTEVAAAARNTCRIISGLPSQEAPGVCVAGLCPQLVKEGQGRANQYQLPSCDLARRGTKKTNPIHNLYNLTLGRKQHLGSAPSGAVWLGGWVPPTLRVTLRDKGTLRFPISSAKSMSSPSKG